MKEMYCGQLGIDEAVYNYGNNVLENLKERFEAIDEVAEYNQLKVIAAMQKNRVAEVLADMDIMMREEILLREYMQIYSRQRTHL